MQRDPLVYWLKVHQVDTVCRFELSWGRGQHLTTDLEFPELLTELYQAWQRAYLSFYQTLKSTRLPTLNDTSHSPLRGRVQASGSMALPPVNRRVQLVEAEATLLRKFHRWLRSPELYEIRAQVAQGVQQAGDHPVDLFLTCHPLALARLPWETWELTAEFAIPGHLRIVRAPSTIRAATEQQGSQRRRPRILVILGDETGLNFQADRVAIQALTRLAEVVFVGWQPGQAIDALRQAIGAAISSEPGWDVLLFAGHSNETQMTGGELAIAPGASMTISELAPALNIARRQGLKFAAFNSCSGLNIAESLIDLGLSQVAIMREPIHNLVAQAFLKQFLQALANHQDVYAALVTACQSLKPIYPSTHLVPSLFRHPDSTLFRIEPNGWQTRLRRLMPRPYEAVGLMTLAAMSLLTPLQDGLMEQRVMVQALYRQATGQLAPATPEILLVQVDNESLIKGEISDPRPMDRAYLAQLVTQASRMSAQVIGIDYLMDRPVVEQDPVLKQALQAAAQVIPNPSPPTAKESRTQTNLAPPNLGSWFVLATHQDDNGTWLEPLPQLANSRWSWPGDIQLWTDGRRMTLLLTQYSSDWPLPFPYLMALALAQYQSSQATTLPTSQSSDLVQHLFSDRMAPGQITTFSYYLRQLWLYPIVDFSIPPEHIFTSIPAWQFLEMSPEALKKQYPQPVVVIMPGGYGDAGVNAFSDDNYPIPAATRYWRRQQPSAPASNIIPGGEIHAYQFHHFWHNHLVVPIPDLWVLAATALFSKLLVDAHWAQRRWVRMGLGLGVPLIYGVLSLQTYITALILLPWLLPTTTLGLYLLPPLIKRKSYG